MAEIASSLVGKVVDFLCSVAKEEISYMWNYSQNVEKLKSEVENLSSMKGRVQQHIDLAKSKGELLLEGVEEWVKKADDKISEARKIITDEAEAKKMCFNLRLCINLSALHYYSKTASKKTTLLVQHQGHGKEFEARVSLPAPIQGFIDLYEKKDLENMNTQKSTLKEITEALDDPAVQIVGINGLGGVGKTTLASEAAAKMKNQFAHIVFIAVSQYADARKIQKKVQVAAQKIMKGEKVLIILDDVWEELKLDEMGIPCGSDKMNCKILLTSRSKDVCEAMNVQKNITLNPLEDDEALGLFVRVVGISKWDYSLKNLAFNIVKECGGLPLFIQAVGKALRNKDIIIWEATLNRLQDPTEEDVRFKRKGIMQLKLSYDYLESEVAKSCFLMCSMIPEDETIGLKRLTYYGLALGIFNNPEYNLHDAKQIVQLVVDSLKSVFLLLPVDDMFHNEKEEEELFKMHDLVRNMAILITSKGNDKFWVKSGIGLKEWQPKKHLESYKKISLMGNQICKLPDHDILFPLLDTFLVQNNQISVVHDDFFEGMENLKVLDMSRNKISSLPRSLKQLTELRMLDLSKNKSLHQISVLGELTCLEILKLRGTGITHIPEEISKLKNLRLLDVFFCEHLSYVTPGVISKLRWLEELYIGLLKDGSYEYLKEVGDSLKVMHLVVPNMQCIRDNTYFKALTEFHLHIPEFAETLTVGSYPSSWRKRLHISKCSFPFKMRIMNLIQVSEVLELWEIEKLDNILPNLYQKGFDELKFIELRECNDVTRLVKPSDFNAMYNVKVFSQLEEIELDHMYKLKVLWDSPHIYVSFCSLMSITITGCPSLTELFPEHAARGLINLRHLYIVGCESLVVVISNHNEKTTRSKNESDFVFPVAYIYLRLLPKLESFYSGDSATKYPSLKLLYMVDCGSLKRWSYGDNHMPNMNFHHEGRLYSNINDYITVKLERNLSFEFHTGGSWEEREELSTTRRRRMGRKFLVDFKLLGKMFQGVLAGAELV